MEKQVKRAFGKKIYYLGKGTDGLNYWLEAPSWDCGWYWGFGYVETYTNNKNPEAARDIRSHQHFDGLFLKRDIFNSFVNFLETPLTEKEVWKLLELMKEFYTLREAAELLGRGGAHITESPVKEAIKQTEIAEKINKELIPAVTVAVLEILSPKM